VTNTYTYVRCQHCDERLAGDDVNAWRHCPWCGLQIRDAHGQPVDPEAPGSLLPVTDRELGLRETRDRLRSREPQTQRLVGDLLDAIESGGFAFSRSGVGRGPMRVEMALEELDAVIERGSP
jgi:hypothetical protein